MDCEEKFVVEYILAVKSMTQANWARFQSLPSRTTQHITKGSVWSEYYSNPDDNKDIIKAKSINSSICTRYLVKWTHLSYLHCSWELECDLRDICKASAVKALEYFNNRYSCGIPIFSDLGLDEYYPPEFAQIEKILDLVEEEETADYIPSVPVSDLHGRNCAVSIKWRDLSYSFVSFEDISDLQNVGIQYVSYLRSHKELEMSAISKSAVTSDKLRPNPSNPILSSSLQLDSIHIFNNYNRLYCHQILGVEWLLKCKSSNKSCILADQSGLGKNVEIFGFLKRLNPLGPVMFITPDFKVDGLAIELYSWTGIVPVKYCGNMDDRKVCEDHEFRYIGESSGLAFKPNCIITTLDAMKTFSKPGLESISWEVIVIDHSYLNSLSHFTKAKSSYLRHAKMWILLSSHIIASSTFDVNSEDITAMFNFIQPASFPSTESVRNYIEEHQQSICNTKMIQDSMNTCVLSRDRLQVNWTDINECVKPNIATAGKLISINIVKMPLSSKQVEYMEQIFLNNASWVRRLRTFLQDQSTAVNTANREYQKKNSRLPISVDDHDKLIQLLTELRKCCIDPRCSWMALEKISLGDGAILSCKQAREKKRSTFLTNKIYPNSSSVISIHNQDYVERLCSLSPKLAYFHNLLKLQDTITHSEVSSPLLRDKQKIVVISQYRSTLDLLSLFLNNTDRQYARVDASSILANYYSSVESFISPSQYCDILLVGLRPTTPTYSCLGFGAALGPALRVVNTVIFYDGILDMDAGNERILDHIAACRKESNKDGPVEIIRLIMENSIESLLFDRSIEAPDQLITADGYFNSLTYLKLTSNAKAKKPVKVHLNMGWPEFNHQNNTYGDELDMIARICANSLNEFNTESKCVLDIYGHDFWSNYLGYLESKLPLVYFQPLCADEEERDFAPNKKRAKVEAAVKILSTSCLPQPVKPISEESQLDTDQLEQILNIDNSEKSNLRSQSSKISSIDLSIPLSEYSNRIADQIKMIRKHPVRFFDQLSLDVASVAKITTRQIFSYFIDYNQSQPQIVTLFLIILLNRGCGCLNLSNYVSYSDISTDSSALYGLQLQFIYVIVFKYLENPQGIIVSDLVALSNKYEVIRIAVFTLPYLEFLRQNRATISRQGSRIDEGENPAKLFNDSSVHFNHSLEAACEMCVSLMGNRMNFINFLSNDIVLTLLNVGISQSTSLGNVRETLAKDDWLSLIVQMNRAFIVQRLLDDTSQFSTICNTKIVFASLNTIPGLNYGRLVLFRRNSQEQMLLTHVKENGWPTSQSILNLLTSDQVRQFLYQFNSNASTLKPEEILSRRLAYIIDIIQNKASKDDVYLYIPVEYTIEHRIIQTLFKFGCPYKYYHRAVQSMPRTARLNKDVYFTLDVFVEKGHIGCFDENAELCLNEFYDELKKKIDSNSNIQSQQINPDKASNESSFSLYLSKWSREDALEFNTSSNLIDSIRLMFLINLNIEIACKNKNLFLFLLVSAIQFNMPPNWTVMSSLELLATTLSLGWGSWDDILEAMNAKENFNNSLSAKLLKDFSMHVCASLPQTICLWDDDVALVPPANQLIRIYFKYGRLPKSMKDFDAMRALRQSMKSASINVLKRTTYPMASASSVLVPSKDANKETNTSISQLKD